MHGGPLLCASPPCPRLVRMARLAWRITVTVAAYVVQGVVEERDSARLSCVLLAEALILGLERGDCGTAPVHLLYRPVPQVVEIGHELVIARPRSRRRRAATERCRPTIPGDRWRSRSALPHSCIHKVSETIPAAVIAAQSLIAFSRRSSFGRRAQSGVHAAGSRRGLSRGHGGTRDKARRPARQAAGVIGSNWPAPVEHRR